MSIANAFSSSLPGISPEVYGPADFKAVSNIVHAHAGIVLPQGKAMLVYSRLAPLVREAGVGTFAAFVEQMRVDEAQRMRAIKALTTNHTFFYREAHHFEHLAAVARPELVSALERGEKVRIWSAGCSSGEETWSLLMTLLGPDRPAGAVLAKRNLRVLASDLATHALTKARAATYGVSEIEPVPEPLRRAWAQVQGGEAVIGDLVRDLVRFRELNLLQDWPMRGRFDVIFCRNVMIYFDNPTKERLVERFAEMLRPGGYLYIGHSERVTGPAARLLAPVGPTIYQRSAR
ncbi:CheR family methyltransferase [Novosphingobium sp. B 225]|uniref:CheR family methyltransferase n=1 Tax=Novosphingobium sp. B 225 TaxID=1961849 RepID=UPI000B4A9ED3|nr:protein-glutamate O-methyltransferase CheR [Novosphingobium sp. B 225]